MKCAVRHKCYRGSRLQSFVSSAILQIHRLLGTYYRVNFICLTDFNREKLLSSLNPAKKIVNPARIYIKPNFTFAEGIRPVPKQPKEKYFLFAGRIEALKGIDIAIKAFEMLPEETLYIAGSGPLEPEMKEYVKERGIKNITFLGYLQKEQMKEKFYHAKAVIMTSQCYEAFAMTIAEAYSYGVPVIAGRVGNMEGMVNDGVTGVKFTYDSAADLAEKVREFNGMDLMKLKENARKFYETRLRPEDNYRKLIDIYESISSES